MDLPLIDSAKHIGITTRLAPGNSSDVDVVNLIAKMPRQIAIAFRILLSGVADQDKMRFRCAFDDRPNRLGFIIRRRLWNRCMLSQEDFARWKSPTRDRAFQSGFVKARAGGNVNDGYTAGVMPFLALIKTRHPLDRPPWPDRVEHNPRIATMRFSNIDVSVFDRVIDIGDDGNRSADLFGP